MSTINHFKCQQGLTLVELLVSLALGLIITAAAGFMLINSQSGMNLQKANLDLQDGTNYGLNFLTSDIRKANFGAPQPVIDLNTTTSGIVFNNSNLPAGMVMNTGLVTLGDGDANWSGLSNTSTHKSDQLTIMYKASQNQYGDQQWNDIISAESSKAAASEGANGVLIVGSDCEGANITIQDVLNQTYIIQRYFLRKDTTGAVEGEPNEPLALACDAKRFSLKNSSTLMESGSANGEILMRRVDHFHVMLGVVEGKNSDVFNNFRYLSIPQFKAITSGNLPRVISIQIGLIARAYESSGSNELIALAPQLLVLNQNTSINNTNASQNKKYVREVLVQTIALRNALGVDSR